MRKVILPVVTLLGALVAAAQEVPLPNQQQTSGSVGIAAGQSAKLSVVYPTIPAPILQVICSATLILADDQGNVLKSKAVDRLIAGHGASVDLNADSEVGGVRTQIHGRTLLANPGCGLISTLEIIDNATGRTVVVLKSDITYTKRPNVPNGD